MELFQQWIREEIHPRILSTVWLDRHIERRLEHILSVERQARRNGISLSIQCDLESCSVSYHHQEQGWDIVLPAVFWVGKG